MKKVFISYTSSDKDIAHSIVDYLEGSGIDCFIAPRDVDAGMPYASNLMKAIEECEVVLLVASHAINKSEHVLNEVDVIVDRNKPLLPVFVEDFELKSDYRYYLGRKQWIIAYPDRIDTYFDKITDALDNYLPKTVKPKIVEIETPKPDGGKASTIFEYIPDRGIMINPEDHQRNVSFRTDTLINLLGGIYEKVEAISDAETAERIFYDSGFASGTNFAERINSQWDTGYSVEGMRQKLAKWCQFDSAVGWGYFTSEIDVDEEHDCLTGTVSINEAFIVDNMKKRKICSFIRGYCTGVVSTLLNSIEVELTCRECPLKSKFKCQCVFDIREK
ncbi:MAG: toll/interleukin-1 receptor domain-containing protein [Clostridia bacterium]|nr:toll/interleukin-1 receptor domain-containing protein [Clostridia bacterium]